MIIITTYKNFFVFNLSLLIFSLFCTNIFSAEFGFLEQYEEPQKRWIEDENGERSKYYEQIFNMNSDFDSPMGCENFRIELLPLNEEIDFENYEDGRISLSDIFFLKGNISIDFSYSLSKFFIRQEMNLSDESVVQLTRNFGFHSCRPGFFRIDVRSYPDEESEPIIEKKFYNSKIISQNFKNYLLDNFFADDLNEKLKISHTKFFSIIAAYEKGAFADDSPAIIFGIGQSAYVPKYYIPKKYNTYEKIGIWYLAFPKNYTLRDFVLYL